MTATRAARYAAKRVDDLDLVDMTAIADRLDVQLNTVHVWRKRDVGFPDPAVSLSVGPIWVWSTVAAWAQTTGRLSEHSRWAV